MIDSKGLSNWSRNCFLIKLTTMVLTILQDYVGKINVKVDEYIRDFSLKKKDIRNFNLVTNKLRNKIKL